MVWAKEARNSIEKRGDLETHSQVRAAIIASYLEGPETNWVPQALFASPHQIFASVPRKYFVPHIVENGTLLIERRWVDSGLPDTEILEALSHVYGRFADLVVDLLNRLAEPVPDLVADTRPDPMGALAMDRALYLSMKDGSRRGFRYFKRLWTEPSLDEERKIVRRYGTFAAFDRLKKATTFREAAEALFDQARVVMLRDGYHQSMTFLFKGLNMFRLIPTDHPDRASRYILMRDLASLAHIDGADGVMMIGESWTAKLEDAPSGFAVDAKNRGEALTLRAANSLGEIFGLEAKIERRRWNTKKVKRLGDVIRDRDGYPFMYYPFQKMWGCVDEKRLQWAVDHSPAVTD